MKFKYDGALTFEDLETGRQLKVDADQSKAIYLQNLDRMITRTKDFLLNNGISYHLFQLDAPIGEAIKLFYSEKKPITLKCFLTIQHISGLY